MLSALVCFQRISMVASAEVSFARVFAKLAFICHFTSLTFTNISLIFAKTHRRSIRFHSNRLKTCLSSATAHVLLSPPMSASPMNKCHLGHR